MKADATITGEKKNQLKLGRKKEKKRKTWPKLHCMSDPQEEGQTDTKSKTHKHCLKRTRNSSRESNATIYELQKIMNIEVPLNVQHENLWIEKEAWT